MFDLSEVEIDFNTFALVVVSPNSSAAVSRLPNKSPVKHGNKQSPGSVVDTTGALIFSIYDLKSTSLHDHKSNRSLPQPIHF